MDTAFRTAACPIWFMNARRFRQETAARNELDDGNTLGSHDAFPEGTCSKRTGVSTVRVGQIIETTSSSVFCLDAVDCFGQNRVEEAGGKGDPRDILRFLVLAFVNLVPVNSCSSIETSSERDHRCRKCDVFRRVITHICPSRGSPREVLLCIGLDLRKDGNGIHSPVDPASGAFIVMDLNSKEALSMHACSPAACVLNTSGTTTRVQHSNAVLYHVYGCAEGYPPRLG